MTDPGANDAAKTGKPALWRAFATTEQAVLLGAAGVTAFATSAPWFLALGAAGAAILAVNKMRELSAEKLGARYRLPPPAVDGLSPAARRQAEDGHAAAQAVLTEIAESPQFVRNLFDVAIESVRALHEKHTYLIRRLQEIERYLAKTDVPRLARERDAMLIRAEKTHDAPTREQFLSAATSIVESLAGHKDLSRDARRIEAQLASIRAALESARSKVLRVKSAEARGVAGEGEAVAAALASLGSDVDALSQAVDEVFTKSKKGPKEIRRDLT